MTTLADRPTGRNTTPTTREAAVGTTPAATAHADDERLPAAARYLFAAARLALGWTFLWAFLDKMFGLGRGTASENAWINGGSPTEGFLTHAATGPFEGFFHQIAGAAWADWLFMVGLAGIGVALLLGVGMRIAAGAGALLMVLMWAAVLPPENNPIVDDHVIYALLLVALAVIGAGRTVGLGRWWERLPLVRRAPWLK